MPRLDKGGHSPLNVTQEARHRVYVGLSWDPNTKAGFMDAAREMMGGKKTWHDLDLACYTFDADGNFIETVNGTGQSTGSSGLIYHSGDNTEGLGNDDDEQISVELKDLPTQIHHIIFTASIKTGHLFGDIEAPEILLADGYSDHIFLRAALNMKAGKDKSSFAFLRLYRGGNGWNIHNIEEFYAADAKQDWPAQLKRHLGA